ncbi:TonB family protein [Altererythrobacter aestiaquae]|uniref:TonB family protein n=2 Tax=Pontixanthobacter aestiaquae TaxID=1509367 RepID=A0A844Z7U9_9SPHN|nr:TonB family protein [Pontixanthobacter aestiaquae]MXO83402.1 TonB family protein [Pontixanthobacter aestiaquae]
MVFVFESVALALFQAASAQPVPQAAELRTRTEPARAIDRYDSMGEPRKPDQKVAPIDAYGMWVRSGDYPQKARTEKRSGQTKIRLAVATSGRVDSCMIAESSGHPDLDEAACRGAQNRARFIPATDANADPIASTYDHTVIWKIRGEPEPSIAQAAMEDAEAAAEWVDKQTAERASPNRLVSLPRAPQLTTRVRGFERRGLNDYPQAALVRRAEGRVTVALSVDSEGNVTKCSVLRPTEDSDLNAASCAGSQEIDVNSPALDVYGNPTEGRVVRTISWQLPAQETVVYSQRSYRRGPEKFPFIENAMIGAAIEAKADGTVISCELLREGELPEEFKEAEKMCDELRQRGMYFVSGFPVRSAEIDPLGAKVRVEVRMQGTRVDNADKPIKE